MKSVKELQRDLVTKHMMDEIRKDIKYLNDSCFYNIPNLEKMFRVTRSLEDKIENLITWKEKLEEDEWGNYSIEF